MFHVPGVTKGCYNSPFDSKRNISTLIEFIGVCRFDGFSWWKVIRKFRYVTYLFFFRGVYLHNTPRIYLATPIEYVG